MIEKKHLTCIGCPMSCPLELTVVNGEICEITGYSCKKGEEYARQEYAAPMRMVSTTIACTSGRWPRLPVKTAAAVPRGKVITIARILHTIEIKAPVHMGQVILEDVAGTGIAVVAARSLPRSTTSGTG